MRLVVLLIGQDSDFQKVVASTLTNSGYQVFYVKNEEIEEAFQHKRPDLVLLDADIESLEGRNIVQKVADLVEIFSLPAILMTPKMPEKEPFFLKKFSQVIVRPFSVLELPNLIASVLKERLYGRKDGTIDTITGLSGTGEFRKQLSYLFSFARRYRRNVSLILVEIKNMEGIREYLANQQLDSLFQEVAMVLRNSVRSLDLVMRCGENRFVILLPMTGNLGLKAVIRRLEESRSSIIWKDVKTKPLVLRLIFAGVSYSSKLEHPEQLLSLAERRLAVKKGS